LSRAEGEEAEGAGAEGAEGRISRRSSP